MTNKNLQRFFLDNDNNGHWYVIPLDKMEDWHTWLNLPEDSEDSWEPPDFVEPVGGWPGLITFENWENTSNK